MSEGRSRKVYGPEFKAKVGLEALKGVKTINEIGQVYGVHPVRYRWGSGRKRSRSKPRACSRASAVRSR